MTSMSDSKPAGESSTLRDLLLGGLTYRVFLTRGLEDSPAGLPK